MVAAFRVKADVYDHMDFALSSLDMFAATTENLINYAFNVGPLPSLLFILLTFGTMPSRSRAMI